MNFLENILAYEQLSKITLVETYYDLSKLASLSTVNPNTQGFSAIEDGLFIDEINKIKRILKYVSKKTNSIEHVYAKKDYGRGRYYFKNNDDKKCYGLQNIYNRVRRIVMNGEYISVDMVNAHPTILQQLCEEYNFKCDKLKAYNLDRKKHIQDIMTSMNVSREVAKNFFLIACFGGDVNTWLENNNIKDDNNVTDFMYDFVSELDRITKKFTTDSNTSKIFLQFIDIATDLKKKKGKKASMSAMALLLQDIESKVLTCMINFMNNNNVKIGALVHDELLVYKNEIINKDKLLELEQYVECELGIKMKFDMKCTTPSEDDIRWFESHKPFMETASDIKYYEDMKTEFEKDHFKILYPSMYVKEGDTPFLFKKESLLDTYSHVNYHAFSDGKLDKRNFVSKWIKDDDIRKYEKMDFLPPPYIVDDNVYNQWSGFAVEKIPKSDQDYSNEVNEILDVFKALAGDDDKAWSYFEKWIAQMLQEPGKIIGIAVLLKSLEGCGKGFMCEVMERIMGSEYFFQSGNAENEVFGRFSNALRFRVLVNINESRAKTNYDYNDLIKHIITAPKVNYEQKGKDQIILKNCARLLFTTNNDFAMPVSDGERRFVIFECSSKYKGKTEVWNKLFKYIDNPAIVRAVYDHFMSVDISNVDWTNDRPKTEAYEELVLYNTPKELRFLLDIAKEHHTYGHTDIRLTSTQLYTEFRRWLDNNGMKDYNTSSIKLGMQMKKYNNVFEKYKAHGVIMNQININKVFELAISKKLITMDEINDPIEYYHEALDVIA